jgi:hypothetical protein
MATKVNKTETLELGDRKITLKPLKIAQMRKFVDIMKQAQTQEDDGDMGLDVAVRAAMLCLEKAKGAEGLTQEDFEEEAEMADIAKILEVCGGVKPDDPNLTAA